MPPYPAIKDPKPRTLIIRCSDPRFRIAFRDFTSKNLGLAQGEFVPINVGGGPAALAHKQTKSNAFQYLMDQVIFFLGHFRTMTTIVIIGHQDCGYYTTIANHPDKTDREKKDLPKAVEAIKRQLQYFAGEEEMEAKKESSPEEREKRLDFSLLLRNIQVEAYYAWFTDDSHTAIDFQKI